MVNGTAPAWVERAGRLERTDACFTSEAEVRHVTEPPLTFPRPGLSRLWLSSTDRSSVAVVKRTPGRQPPERLTSAVRA